ncbi:MAG: hypothetical protein ACTHM6_12270 [Tepidisphaeraceae bacterium]
MPAEQDVPTIVARVKQLLTDAQTQGIHLRLSAYRLDDDWLYLVVEPIRPNERASQHAHFMTQTERTLLKEGYGQVLIVPAVPEHAGLTEVR